MEILRCENVRKVYGSGNNQVVALDHIDLSVQKGEFVAIVGASGSGKSTLLHILGSVDQPTEGNVLIEGTDISTMNQTQAAIFRRRKVGLVYQFYNLIPTLTVRKNILMPLLLDKRKPNQVKCLLLALLLEIAKMNANETENRTGLEKYQPMISVALDYISDNYAQEIRIQDLAKLCHISETHFRRVFHACMQMTPADPVTTP